MTGVPAPPPEQPTECPHCGSRVEYTTNESIYGRRYGRWPYCYVCTNPDCGAYVGTHPKTNRALGSLATPTVRNARKRAHAAFDPLWKSGTLDRGHAYQLLADALEIPRANCHIGWFDEDLCRRVVESIPVITAGGQQLEAPPDAQ